jgi:hypothetical protein
MSITISFLFRIAVLIVFIFILFKIKNRKKRYIFMFSFAGLLVISYIYSSLFNVTPVTMNYRQLSIDGVNSYDQLIISDGKFMDQESGAYASYIDDSGVVRHPEFHPVFISDAHEDYYFVIFSRNQQKIIEDFYTQNDYEWNPLESDVIAIISKTSGLIEQPSVYDLIGFTIGLDFMVTDQTIRFPVYKPYTREINYYFVIVIDEQYDILSSMTNLVFFAGSDRTLVNHVYTNHMYLGVYSDHEMDFYTVLYEFDYASRNGTMYWTGGGGSSRRISDLDDELYVKQGYFIAIDDAIYYVNNDLKIYRYTLTSNTYVSDVIDLEHWMNQIS